MRSLTRNLGSKLFALIVAFVVWLSVANEPDLTTIVSVPVQYNHLPENLEISSEIVDSVSIEARGPSGLLHSLKDSQIAAIIDFAGVASPSERTFTLTTAQLKLPRGIELVRTTPAQLRFRFERRMVRTVPVEVAYSGALPPGYTIAHVSVDPPGLQIAGPQSRVDKVKKLLSDPFDLSAVKVDAVTAALPQSLTVYVAEPQVRFSGNPQVTVKVGVKRSR